MKQNKIDLIEFPAESIKDISAAKNFYANVFGWNFQDLDEDYIDTKSSGVACGFNADPSHRPSKPLVVVYSEDIESSKQKVVSSGGKITKDIFSFPGGKRFHFTDLAGNELAAWSDK